MIKNYELRCLKDFFQDLWPSAKMKGILQIIFRSHDEMMTKSSKEEEEIFR